MNMNKWQCAVMAVLTTWAVASNAGEVQWDGRTYIPVGIRQRSDVVLRFDEPIKYFWSEAPSKVEIHTIGKRTLVLRATTDHPQQRLFVEGGDTHTVFVAHLSRRLPYAPTITVVNAQVQGVAPASTDASSASGNIIQMMKVMMRGVPVSGVSIRPSKTVLLDQAPYQIRAISVWKSLGTTGIIATVTKNTPLPAVTFRPQDIQIVIPSLGLLRGIGADRWDLTATEPRLTAYLVFEK